MLTNAFASSVLLDNSRTSALLLRLWRVICRAPDITTPGEVSETQLHFNGLLWHYDLSMFK